MSRAGLYGSLLVAVAAASLVSCRRQNLIPADDPKEAIRFLFTCHGGIDSVGLAYTDASKTPAWSIRKFRDDEIEWIVNPNVTFNILTKAGSAPMPIDTIQHQSGSGKPLKVRVKHDPGPPKTYSYSIDATCTPQTGAPVRLVVDPEMIVRPGP